MNHLSKLSPILVFLGVVGITSPAFAGGDSVSPKAYDLIEILGIPITNAMLTSWIFSLIIILVIRNAVGTKPKLVPSKGQAVVESMVESIRGIVGPIVGNNMVKVTFPLLIGFFTFILIHNWSGLLPGVGTFGIIEEDHGVEHLLYFFRPGNADLNTTIALALVSFVAWFYFIFKYAGPQIIAKDLFGNKADKNDVPGAMYSILTIIFLLVGCIEIVSIIFRPVSLSFRLFGNVFGGESLLTSMTGLISWIVPVPFYFLELLIGFVQALVFTLLVSVYIGLICNHGDDEEHAH